MQPSPQSLVGKLGAGSRPQLFPSAEPTWAVAFAVFLVFGTALVIASLAKGPWLDEFWSVYLGGAGLTAPEALSTRWLLDVNPLTANLLYTTFERLVGTNIAALRSSMNIFALVFLFVASLIFYRNSTDARVFYPLSVIVTLGTFDSLTYASEFRAYFWLIVATLVAFQYVHFSLSEKNSPTISVQILGCAAIILSLNLHYVSTFIVSFAYAFVLASAWVLDNRLTVVRLATVIGLSALVAVVCFLIQCKHFASVLDVHWVRTTTWLGISLFLYIAAKFAVSSCATISILAWSTLTKVRRERHLLLNDPVISRALLLALSIPASGLALLTLNAIQPFIVDRYLFAWYPIASTALSLLLTKVVRDLRAAALLAGASAFGVIGYVAARESRKPHWKEGLVVATDAVAACPGTQLLAAAGWRFGVSANSQVARRETEVIGMGVRQLARSSHLQMKALDATTPIIMNPGNCPTLVWVPHIYGVDQSKPPSALLRSARIWVPSRAHVTMLLESPETLIFKVQRAHPQSTSTAGLSSPQAVRRSVLLRH